MLPKRLVFLRRRPVLLRRRPVLLGHVKKELLNKETNLLKQMQFCQGHAKTLGARLEQLEECQEDL